MQKKKYVLLTILCIFMVMVLSACSKKEEGKTEETSKEESVHVDDGKDTTDTTEETNNEDIFASVTCATMWIEEMTAEEAFLAPIDAVDEHKYDGQTATVVGVMLRDESGAECVQEIHELKWCHKEGEEFVEIKEVTHLFTDYFMPNVGVVYGRFLKDAVDVDNLYVCIQNSEDSEEKYFKIEPDNCLDMQALNDSNVVVEEQGSIFYLQDVPFMIIKSSWVSTGAGGYKDGLTLATEGKEINFIPLICTSHYDFSITDSSTASGITENEDYVITYNYVWENTHFAGTLPGMEVRLNFKIGKIYDKKELDAYNQQNTDGEFFEELSKEVYAKRPFDNMCIIMDNQNREDTQFHIGYKDFVKEWLEEQGY